MPGAFMPEESVKKVRVRDIVMSVPDRVYAYYFFEREEVETEDETLRGEEKNPSGKYYPDGTVYTLEEIEARKNPNDHNLISMMRHEKCKVIQTRLGNWQPFYKEDRLV